MFGVYNSLDPMDRIQLFAGSSSTGDFALLTIFWNGDVFVDGTPTGTKFPNGFFGFYIDSSANANGGLWYSGYVS